MSGAAIGYAQASGIPYAEGLVKNRYVGRTFIMPDQRIREQCVRLKYNPMREVLEGKRIVVVDDSIVRATTTRFLIKMLRDAGAKEVHMRVSSPPITHPCFFGIDMGRRWELIAARETIEEIRDDIGADSLGYLTEQGLIEAVGQPRESFCMACFTGEYPMDVPQELDKLSLEPRTGPETATRSSGSRATAPARAPAAATSGRSPEPPPGPPNRLVAPRQNVAACPNQPSFLPESTSRRPIPAAMPSLLANAAFDCPTIRC